VRCDFTEAVVDQTPAGLGARAWRTICRASPRSRRGASGAAAARSTAIADSA
jgi:hypothetical protein